MADALHEAWLDLQDKREIWRGAEATFDHVRTTGDESAAIVHGIAERFQATGDHQLSTQEAQAVKDLEDAKAALALATDAKNAARESLITADREYKKLELAWAESGLSRFHECWCLARAPKEARRG
jgi:hypothetical protein